MENISDERIENGFILASRLGRSDPGQGGSGSASRMLRITRSGTKLWEELPDSDRPHSGSRIRRRRSAAIAPRVLQAATQRLKTNTYQEEI
jgi:hypothetical protein